MTDQRRSGTSRREQTTGQRGIRAREPARRSATTTPIGGQGRRRCRSLRREPGPRPPNREEQAQDRPHRRRDHRNKRADHAQQAPPHATHQPSPPPAVEAGDDADPGSGGVGAPGHGSFGCPGHSSSDDAAEPADGADNTCGSSNASTSERLSLYLPEGERTTGKPWSRTQPRISRSVHPVNEYCVSTCFTVRRSRGSRSVREVSVMTRVLLTA